MKLLGPYPPKFAEKPGDIGIALRQRRGIAPIALVRIASITTEP